MKAQDKFLTKNLLVAKRFPSSADDLLTSAREQQQLLVVGTG